MEKIYWLMSPLLNILRYNIGIGEGFGCLEKEKKWRHKRMRMRMKKKFFLSGIEAYYSINILSAKQRTEPLDSQ